MDSRWKRKLVSRRSPENAKLRHLCGYFSRISLAPESVRRIELPDERSHMALRIGYADETIIYLSLYSGGATRVFGVPLSLVHLSLVTLRSTDLKVSIACSTCNQQLDV